MSVPLIGRLPNDLSGCLLQISEIRHLKAAVISRTHVHSGVQS